MFDQNLVQNDFLYQYGGSTSHIQCSRSHIQILIQPNYLPRVLSSNSLAKGPRTCAHASSTLTL